MDNGIRFWNRIAKLYGPIQEKSNRKLYTEIIEKCKPYLAKNQQVLELACGTGQLTFPLCGLTASWEATDYSAKMIGKATSLGPCAAHFSVQDALHLPYADESFDTVVIANALHIIPEPEKALAEIRRVLKPGGILLAPTFIYEGKIHTFRMWFTQRLGFPPFHKWTAKEFLERVENTGFSTLKHQIIPADPVPEVFAVFQK